MDKEEQHFVKAPMDDLENLITEARNEATKNIDLLSTIEMLRSINEADQSVAGAVAQEIPSIACAVDGIVEKLRLGGHLFYLGAGTSGRLGVLDASECPPTFNISPDIVQGIIAGGDTALRSPLEGGEDDSEAAVKDLQERGFSSSDVLVGIAASGRTPYVLGGIEYVKRVGATTIGISCAPHSLLAQAVDFAISPDVGPEVIAGSTRLKAGTATKLVLNMLSTGAMIRLGYVYENLMVNVQPTNEKLRQRALGIVMEVTGSSKDEAVALLRESGSVNTAIAMYQLDLTKEEAEQRLTRARGQLREVLG
jgi:N-acetylmuramic acid 6-phosphate etherase